MADIFISYSKSEREVTEALARDLKAAGYSVWWDTGLVAGDVYKDVILREIASAKAAIVIWTKSSVGSEWVYSEANRAHAKRKLIPLRTANIAPDDIPPPFDALHTELVTNRAAVLAGLAKYGIVPTATSEPATGRADKEPVEDRQRPISAGRVWAWLAKRPIVSLGAAALLVLALIAIPLLSRPSPPPYIPTPDASTSPGPATQEPVQQSNPTPEPASTDAATPEPADSAAQKAATELLQSAKSGDTTALADLRSDMSGYTDETKTELQRQLANEGFYRGSLDGDWGSGSRAALEEYLKAR